MINGLRCRNEGRTDAGDDEKVHPQKSLLISESVVENTADIDTDDGADGRRLSNGALPRRRELVLLKLGIPLTKFLDSPSVPQENPP